MEERKLDFVCIGVDDGGRIPIENTGRGRDKSPEFLLSNLSPRAKTLAVTLEDMSHPIRNFTHWVIWNIPAANHIQGGIAAGKTPSSPWGARQGAAYGWHQYAGPKPPRGKSHRYRFTVYTLDSALELRPWAGKSAFLKKAEGHIIQVGSIIARFE